MTKTKLLVGSLSNDLFRVASLTQRGSLKAAARFLQEAKRWSTQLTDEDVKPYIRKIAADVSNQSEENLDLAQAEKNLMYGVLLQNYSLHTE